MSQAQSHITVTGIVTDTVTDTVKGTRHRPATQAHVTGTRTGTRTGKCHRHATYMTICSCISVKGIMKSMFGIMMLT